MMISGYSITPYRLPFTSPWKSHYGTRRHREGFLIELTDHDGNRGVGEAAPLEDLGTETLHQCHQQLLKLEETIPHADIEEVHSLLSPLKQKTPASCCGIESATVALLAQQQQQSPSQWLNPQAARTIRLNQIVPDLTAPAIDSHGGTTIKLKLGIHPLEKELEMLQRLVNTLSPAQQLRLDCNQAWSMAESIWFLQKIEDLPIESLEEPLQNPTLPALLQLQQQTDIPITIDESLPAIGLSTLLESSQQPQRTVLKPTLHCGPLSTCHTARQLQQHNIDVVITSTLESNIGILMAAHCAAAIDPQQRLEHGLDTGRLFSKNLALAPSIKNGILHLP